MFALVRFVDVVLVCSFVCFWVNVCVPLCVWLLHGRNLRVCCYRCLMTNVIPAVSVTGDDASDHKCCYRYLFERLDGRIRGNLRQEAIDRFSKPGKMFVSPIQVLCMVSGHYCH